MTARNIRSAMLWAIILAVAQSACYNPDAYTLGPDRIEQILSIEASATMIAADGIARITISAQIDPRADVGKRLVTFTTTGGTLVSGSQEGSTTTVPADERGRAVVDLRSAISPGPARVDVRVGTVSRSLNVQFVAVRREELFDIDLTRTTVPADGFSTTRITVTLLRLGTLQQHVVKFETSAGTLLATGVASTHQASVTADPNGVAIIDLQSDKTVGSVRLAITALDRTENLEIAFVPVDPEQIVTVSADPHAVAADGATIVAVAARVAPNLPSGRRSVTFRTTIGQFLPGRRDEFAIDADGSNMARATLVSTAIGDGRLTATVDGTTAEANVQFIAALPDNLFVSAAAAALKSGESTLVTATLLRNIGEVSAKLQVNYSAVTADGAPIGTFSGVTLSDHGVSSATFNVGSNTYVGMVTIKASVSGGGAGSTMVQLVP